MRCLTAALLLILSAAGAKAQNQDRAALVALYEATDGANWTDNTNWLSDKPLGEWKGVSVRGGRVIDLQLPSNNLTGPVPPELGQLEKLESLVLYVNDLTGSIPPELGQLENLKGLHLYSNNLTGSIPPELGQLENLRSLRLSPNNLTGPVPPELGQLKNLKDLRLPSDICIPDNLVEWAVERHFSILPCNVNDRLLPLSLLREDGNGLSLALPANLQNPSSVTILDASVASVSAAAGWLTITPRGQGTTEIEVVPPGGGDAWLAGVEVRAAVGTFGIDIVMERPAPATYAPALTTAADWSSSALDGTEWPDRVPTCFTDKATALADELLIHARWGDNIGPLGYAETCFREDGNQAVFDTGGGRITVEVSAAADIELVQHEIGHLLGLVLWGPETGLVTADRAYFIGPRAVETFRAIGGDPTLPGVPIAADGAHWSFDVTDFMSRTGRDTRVSLAALADAGYTVSDHPLALSATVVEVPVSIRLGQNYPNPFNPQTTIEYELSSPEHVRLEVYDALGRRVRVLVDGMRPSGPNSIRFDADGLSSGLYVYRLQTGRETVTKTMTLLR